MSNELAVQGTTLSSKIEYAQAMAGSNLLPASYRGNPANLLFALEYADALGVSPIHAITSIHVISGKPSASADLIAATIRRAGHKLRVIGDDTYAEATLIRADDPEFEYVARWDLAKAKQAGLNTSTWKAYPAAMLRSRAITEVGRMGASDALFGVVYTPEELGAEVDKDGVPVAPTFRPEKPQQTSRKPASLSDAMASRAPESAPIEDLGEQPPSRDFLAEARAADGVDAIRAIWMDAQAAGAPADVLDKIRAVADAHAPAA